VLAQNDRALPAQFVDLLHVVKHVNAHALKLQRKITRDLCRPRALVIVPSDGVDRRYSAQFLEDLRPTDVSGVDDASDSCECADCFRAKQPVCIGNEAYRFQLFRCPAQTSVWHGKCAVMASGCANITAQPRAYSASARQIRTRGDDCGTVVARDLKGIGSKRW
jgi:hypothetical protein